MRVAVKCRAWEKSKIYQNWVYSGTGKRDTHPEETTRPGMNLG
jgi:hypothetical protein